MISEACVDQICFYGVNSEVGRRIEESLGRSDPAYSPLKQIPQEPLIKPLKSSRSAHSSRFNLDHIGTVDSRTGTITYLLKIDD